MTSGKDKNNKRPSEEKHFPTISSASSAEELGGQIGPYKLLSVLGEGGFGIVYLAERQRPVRRRVALKVIKPGMDSKQVIARFETEREALALLEHPNIASVFDAGTTEAARPYFAMEYVEGLPLTEHCDREKLSIDERLELFLQVCEAVEHAHRKGIIHRDIKPSNILVSVLGDKAAPKIIDFGVAKAISQPLTERTLFTEQGQLLGTPEYMSPEQAEMAAPGIDTRTDIYSLGVLLYELLTGVLPFDRKTLQQAGFAEIQRIIREKDPPRPSTRLSSLGEEAKEVAESRRTEVATLAKRLHKELEWIPLKAMRKERKHRYRSASELADDIKNYLNGAPLIAGPPSTLYQLKKFVRRNQAKVMAAAIVVVAIVGMVVFSTIVEKMKIREFTAEATELLQKGAYKKAEETFAKILALDQSDLDAHEGISQARGQQELTRQLKLAEQYLDDSMFGQALGVALSAQQRFPNDPRVLEIVRRAKGTATLSVKFDLGKVTKATLKEIIQEGAEPGATLPIRELLSPNGIDISPGWYWLTISYEPNEATDGRKRGIKEYLLFVRRESSYRIHARTLLVGNVPEADFTTLKEALHNCQPGYILRLAPGEHRLNDKDAPFTEFHTGVPNLTIESGDRQKQATIIFYHFYVQSTWDVVFSNLRLLGVKRPTEAYPGTIHFENSARCTVAECNIEWARLRVEDCDGLDVRGNVFTRSSHHMIWISDSRRVVVQDNKEAKPNLIHNRSFLFEDCEALLLLNNTIDRSSLIGMSLNRCFDTIIMGNSVQNNGEGEIRLSNCWGAILAFNNVRTDGGYGVYILNDPFPAEAGVTAPATLLQHNQIRGGQGAIFSHSGYNIIYKNNLLADAKSGIFFERGGWAQWIEKNIFVNNARVLGIGDYEKQWWSHGTMRNNLVDRTIDCNTSGPIPFRMDIEDNTICDFELGQTLRTAVYLPLVSKEDEQTLVLKGHTFGPAVAFKTKGLEVCEAIAKIMHRFGAINSKLTAEDGLGEPLKSRLEHLTYRISKLGAPNVKGEYLGVFSEQQLGVYKLSEHPEKIPPQAKSFRGHHYLVYVSPTPWKAAKEFCESVGGHLATITSREEHSWICKTFPPSWRYWIGGTDEDEEGEWKWVTGEKWEYSSWNEGEPNNQNGVEHVLHMWQNGNWNDENTERQLWFLIEWDR